GVAARPSIARWQRPAPHGHLSWSDLWPDPAAAARRPVGWRDRAGRGRAAAGSRDDRGYDDVKVEWDEEKRHVDLHSASTCSIRSHGFSTARSSLNIMAVAPQMI